MMISAFGVEHSGISKRSAVSAYRSLSREEKDAYFKPAKRRAQVASSVLLGGGVAAGGLGGLALVRERKATNTMQQAIDAAKSGQPYQKLAQEAVLHHKAAVRSVKGSAAGVGVAALGVGGLIANRAYSNHKLRQAVNKAEGRDRLSDISMATMLGGGAGAVGLGINAGRHRILSERAAARRHVAALSHQGRAYKQEGARVLLHNQLAPRNVKAAGALGAVGLLGAGGYAGRKIYMSRQEPVIKMRIPLPRRKATSRESARRFREAMHRAFGTPAPPPQPVHTPFYKKRSNQVIGGLAVAGVGVGGGIGYKKSKDAQAQQGPL